MATVLVVDDDRSSLRALADWVRREGFEVRTAESLEKARAAVAEAYPDIALIDLQLPDGSGLDLLPDLEEPPGTEVVFVTGHASVDSAVEALRHRVSDYLTKPADLSRLRRILGNVQRTLELRREIGELRQELRKLGRFGRLIGASPPMQKVYDQILRVAPTSATVFVRGETGTGKELVAETVHRLSRRAKQPFVAVNCGAMSPALIESELFGHERGSFTGAERKHRGFFEQADGGTLFLDEITEMPLELQVKLLRALETGEVLRVGGDRSLAVDVRLIAATNRDPERAVAEGKLRRDLLYRLLVFPVELPPLRERGDDLELLANHFLAVLNDEAGSAKRLAPEALERLRAHGWPGNVRELANVIERAFILAGDAITPSCVPLDGPALAPTADARVEIELGSRIADAERKLILATLEHLEGDKRQAAKTLGISLKTLYNRLNSYRGS